MILLCDHDVLRHCPAKNSHCFAAWIALRVYLSFPPAPPGLPSPESFMHITTTISYTSRAECRLTRHTPHHRRIICIFTRHTVFFSHPKETRREHYLTHLCTCRSSPATRLLGLFALLLAISISPLFFSAQRHRSGPSLEFPLRSLDLGEGKPGQALTGQIPILNTGSAPLTFSVATSCGCTSAEPKRGTLEPGGKSSIQVVLTLPEYSKSEKAIQVIVTTNDEVNSTGRCAVVARVPAPFEVTPAFVAMHKRADSSESMPTTAVTVRLPTGNARPNAGISGPFSFLRHQLDATKYQFEINCLADLPHGDHFGMLTLFVEGAESEKIRIPLQLCVAPEFEVIPASTRVNSTSNCLDFIALTHSHEIGQLSIEEPMSGLRLEQLHAISGKRRQYRLHLKDPLLKERLPVRLRESNSGTSSILTLLSTPPKVER